MPSAAKQASGPPASSAAVQVLTIAAAPTNWAPTASGALLLQ
jgi:hypothetical protein